MFCSFADAESFNGRATYYSAQGGITACGERHSDSDFIAALNKAQFDPNTPNGNPNRNWLCNKQIQVKGPHGTATVLIVDRCPSCPYGALDLSPAAFKQIVGSLGKGVGQITWWWK